MPSEQTTRDLGAIQPLGQLLANLSIRKGTPWVHSLDSCQRKFASRAGEAGADRKTLCWPSLSEQLEVSAIRLGGGVFHTR